MLRTIRFWRWVALGGATLAGGCVTSFQQNLDVLLSPSAASSLLSAGQAAVLPLVRLLRWAW